MVSLVHCWCIQVCVEQQLLVQRPIRNALLMFVAAARDKLYKMNIAVHVFSA